MHSFYIMLGLQWVIPYNIKDYTMQSWQIHQLAYAFFLHYAWPTMGNSLKHQGYTVQSWQIHQKYLENDPSNHIFGAYGRKEKTDFNLFLHS